MRLKEDNSSWKSGGIKRRMYRQAPLTPDQEIIKGHPKRRRKKSKPKTKLFCKHVWVKVSFEEYKRYHKGYGWWCFDDTEPPYWTKYTTYFVCAGCLTAEAKTDKGRMRAYHRRRRYHNK